MKKAFVLGGTVPHASLIRKLKARGYYVILIDYTENPPAADSADLHLRESTLDKEKVLELAKSYGIDLIISTCIDQANSTACYVSECLGLPHPYSFETSLDVTRKGRMKKIFKEFDIPTADFYVVNKAVLEEPKLEFPLVVKPTDANSSKGVFRVETLSDCYEKLNIALEISREGKAIVEKYISGTEIQVDCIAVDGVAHILMTRDKETMQIDGKELQVAGFSIPGEVCESVKEELKSIAQKIVTAFSLKNTPFFYQAICNSNGVYVLEFAPRIAGGTTYQMVKMYTGFDYLEAAIKSFLHEPIEVFIEENSKKYVSRFLYMRPGKFEQVTGIDMMEKDGTVDCYFPFINPGKVVTESFNSGNRVGAIMVKGDSYSEAKDRLAGAMKNIQILDDHQVDLNFWKDNLK